MIDGHSQRVNDCCWSIPAEGAGLAPVQIERYAETRHPEPGQGF